MPIGRQRGSTPAAAAASRVARPLKSPSTWIGKGPSGSMLADFSTASVDETSSTLPRENEFAMRVSLISFALSVDPPRTYSTPVMRHSRIDGRQPGHNAVIPGLDSARFVLDPFLGADSIERLCLA